MALDHVSKTSIALIIFFSEHEDSTQNTKTSSSVNNWDIVITLLLIKTTLQ